MSLAGSARVGQTKTQQQQYKTKRRGCAPQPHTVAQLKAEGEPFDIGKSGPLFFLDLTNVSRKKTNS